MYHKYIVCIINKFEVIEILLNCTEKKINVPVEHFDQQHVSNQLL